MSSSIEVSGSKGGRGFSVLFGQTHEFRQSSNAVYLCSSLVSAGQLLELRRFDLITVIRLGAKSIKK